MTDSVSSDCRYKHIVVKEVTPRHIDIDPVLRIAACSNDKKCGWSEVTCRASNCADHFDKNSDAAGILDLTTAGLLVDTHELEENMGMAPLLSRGLWYCTIYLWCGP